jgi:hypothetical protein
VKDSFEQKVNVGDTVVYATRSASTTSLKVAWVLEIDEEKGRMHVRTVAENGWSDFTRGKWHGGYNKEGEYVSENDYDDPSYITWITPVNCVVLGEFDVQPLRRIQQTQRLRSKEEREARE